MVPLYTNQTPTILGAPAGWDKEKDGPCVGLPVRIADGVFYSFWDVSWKERFKIFFGKPIRLAVRGGGHPPVWLDMED